MMNKQTKIAIIIIILVLGFGGYFAYVKYFFARTSEAPKNENVLPLTENSATSTPEKIIPKEITILSGYKLYKNTEFGFEIQYPDSWTVSEEDIVNVRGENTKGFFFKKPGSDLRFAILPKDGLSYNLPSESTSENINISGFMGVQTKYILPDGRRLLLVHPQTNVFNWDQEIGRLDIESTVADPVGDFAIFNKILNSFKLSH